eukprot:1150565-Pelagomonas_calceolata.AAC.4
MSLLSSHIACGVRLVLDSNPSICNAEALFLNTGPPPLGEELCKSLMRANQNECSSYEAMHLELLGSRLGVVHVRFCRPPTSCRLGRALPRCPSPGPVAHAEAQLLPQRTIGAVVWKLQQCGLWGLISVAAEEHKSAHACTGMASP